jgi:hypothetical protein
MLEKWNNGFWVDGWWPACGGLNRTIILLQNQHSIIPLFHYYSSSAFLEAM